MHRGILALSPRLPWADYWRGVRVAEGAVLEKR